MRSTLRIALLAACTATAMTVAAQSAATDTVRLTPFTQTEPFSTVIYPCRAISLSKAYSNV